MDSAKILEYWCSPDGLFRDLSENDVFSKPECLVFQGGRGTGKTMFLKYFSYHVQKNEALNNRGSIISHLRSRGGIGIYLRFDGAVLISLSGSPSRKAPWDTIFTHYFELRVCKAYLEIMKDLIDSGEIKSDLVSETFLPEVNELLGCQNIKSVDLVLSHVNKLLREVTEYRANSAFIDESFAPTKIFGSTDLSFSIPEIASRLLPELSGLLFVIMIDEYENFSDSQQRVVNTLLKFRKNPVTFRIGMRLEGFHTFDTVSSDEFIKEGRDYRGFAFESFLQDKKGYREFLMNVARKRLESSNSFRDITNISRILGKKEDFEEEARALVHGRDNHFRLLLLEDKEEWQKVKSLISFPDNPLIEMLNILLVNRGNDPNKVHEAMVDFLDGKVTPFSKKYKNDYINKYKLSLLFVLITFYHGNKEYYSFNTFMYLSAGNVSYFLELCFQTFRFALFENRELFLQSGLAPIKAQTRAAIEVGNKEFEMIKRIPNYGSELFNLATNLGNLFRIYHRDYEIRYPEMNLFAVNDNTDKASILLKAAIRWSVVQKKFGRPQTYSPGGSKVQLYSLNKIFFPLFDISYRTRGGINELVSISEMSRHLEKNELLAICKMGKRKKTLLKKEEPSLFDL